MRSGAPWLQRQAPGFVQSIIATIDRNVVGPFGSGLRQEWEEGEHTSNWLGVCAGGILSVCRSLAALGEPRLQSGGSIPRVC